MRDRQDGVADLFKASWDKTCGLKNFSCEVIGLLVSTDQTLKREGLLQFLIKAVVLSSLGGLVGLLLATWASIGLAQLMKVPISSTSASTCSPSCSQPPSA
ncbi:MAG: hypothetical protein P3W87_008200 [Gammaproteobacteria bacterium]|nr:hypothetical protein [Gammaproteobacteria bacterium]